MESDGGIPREKSSGLLTSTTILLPNGPGPTDRTTSSSISPFKQRNEISLNAAASVKVPVDALAPFVAAHFAALSFFAVREPILTWQPNCTNFFPSASPTI